MRSAPSSPEVSGRILDGLPFAVIGLDSGDCVIDMNPAAETLFARSASVMRGRPFSDVLPPDSPFFDVVRRARREGGAVLVRRVRLASPQLSMIEADLSVSVEEEDGDLVVAFIPSSAVKEEAASEVTAVAQVARMLGHEVKNPLAGIVGAAQLLSRQARDDQQALLSLIREEGARIERIVDRFAAFETFFAPRMRPTNVHAVLDSVVSLAKASFGAATRFDLQYDPSLPEIDVDPDHLHEACLNLVKNAVEAATGGARQARVNLITRYRAGFRFAGRDAPGARGALEICVTDNGPGVPETVAQRVFEPFYTTKSNGAGVGLAVVAEIMSAHGGFVTLDNSPGGATVRLMFPFARKKNGAI